MCTGTSVPAASLARPMVSSSGGRLLAEGRDAGLDTLAQQPGVGGVAAAITKPSTARGEQAGGVRRPVDAKPLCDGPGCLGVGVGEDELLDEVQTLEGLGVEGADPSYACKPNAAFPLRSRRCVPPSPTPTGTHEARGVVLFCRSAWQASGHTVNPLFLHSHVLSSPKTCRYAAGMAKQLDVRIDRGSPIPLYHQLAEQLSHAIATGALQPGDPFENEIALADRLGLSRPTVRRAIHEPRLAGLLLRRRGLGTTVANRQIHRRPS